MKKPAKQDFPAELQAELERIKEEARYPQGVDYRHVPTRQYWTNHATSPLRSRPPRLWNPPEEA